MRVTDEQLDRLWRIRETLTDFADIAALELAISALSHAAGQECTLGVGDGSGQLFVHGSYDAIKACQALILRGEVAGQEAVHSVKDAGIELSSRETFVPCDCGCGRSCCAHCGVDVGFLTPAQPPASAEVGRDRLLRAIQDEKSAWTGDYRDAAYRALDDMLARFDAAMAASSGRKGVDP